MYNLTVDQVHTFFVGEGQWLVHNSSCGEFAKTLEDGSGILASVDKDGVFWTVLEVNPASKGQGVGKGLYNEAFSSIGQDAKAIGAQWSYGDNLATFNKLTASGMSPAEAAKLTFTGKQATGLGFSNPAVQAIGTPGNYTKVVVIFNK
jgi:hypothetical protein